MGTKLPEWWNDRVAMGVGIALAVLGFIIIMVTEGDPSVVHRLNPQYAEDDTAADVIGGLMMAAGAGLIGYTLYKPKGGGGNQDEQA